MPTGTEPMLARLLRARLRGVETLDGAEGLPESELVAVVDGADPSPWLLRQLAPALEWYASDLFVIAGVSLPEDLASAARPVTASTNR